MRLSRKRQIHSIIETASGTRRLGPDLSHVDYRYVIHSDGLNRKTTGTTASTLAFLALTYPASGACMSRGVLTAATDGPAGTFSGWVHLGAVTVTGEIYIFTLQQGCRLTVATTSAAGEYKFNFVALTTDSLTQLIANSERFTLDASWHHVYATWDTSREFKDSFKILVDRVDVTSLATEDADYGADIDYTVTDVNIAGIHNTTPAFRLYGGLGPFYLNIKTRLDPTNFNLDKFVTRSLAPVALGSSATIPAGERPAIFMNGGQGDFGAGTNHGYGGNFTVTGTTSDFGTLPT